eukprot:2187648-Pyramimonas_sp.AAC.1
MAKNGVVLHQRRPPNTKGKKHTQYLVCPVCPVGSGNWVYCNRAGQPGRTNSKKLSLIHISEPTRPEPIS